MITRPGLPAGWADFAPAAPAPVTAGPFPARACDTGPAVDASPEAAADAPTRRRRFRLRRRSRSRDAHAGAPAHEAHVDLDLVALEAEHWTDLTLAALEDTGADDDLTLHDPASAPSQRRGEPDPWAVLAEELHGDRDHDVDDTGQAVEPAPPDLETEFWAGGSR